MSKEDKPILTKSSEFLINALKKPTDFFEI